MERPIKDVHSLSAFKDVALHNNRDWIAFKHKLVHQRKQKKVSLEQVAVFLQWSEEHVKAFEHYDYDPRISEVRQYAMAVMMTIDSDAKQYEGETMSVSLNMDGIKDVEDALDNMNNGITNKASASYQMEV